MACSSLGVLRFVAFSLALAWSTVASAQALPEAPASSRAAGPTLTGAELLWPAAPPPGAVAHPILVRGHDMGLVSAGIVGLSLGMAVGFFIAGSDLAYGNCHDFSGRSFTSTRVSCGTAAFSLIPFAGSVVVGTVGFEGSVGIETLLPGVLAVAPQIAGLILLLLGVHGYTEDLVAGTDVGGLSFRLEPTVSSSQLGATLSVSL